MGLIPLRMGETINTTTVLTVYKIDISTSV
jgi:hypothetical protein